MLEIGFNKDHVQITIDTRTIFPKDIMNALKETFLKKQIQKCPKKISFGEVNSRA